MLLFNITSAYNDRHQPLPFLPMGSLQPPLLQTLRHEEMGISYESHACLV